MKRTAAVIAALLLASVATADVPSRPANPRELAVIQKVVNAVVATLDKFENSDWHKTNEWSHDHFDVAIDPGPLNTSLGCDRDYEIRGGSALWNAKIQPVVDQINALVAKRDLDQMMKVQSRIDGKLKFSVEVSPNIPSVGGSEADFAHDLGARGAAFSYCDKGDELECAVVLGDWAHHSTAADGYRNYKFVHAADGVPAIENLVIRFRSQRREGFAAERAMQLIQTTNWAPISASLTK
ncbi:MAG TPA: hypothetical protein VKH35_12810 [Thermoanaerobaculia bacterium]|nr:hypothetical protein [Thermoanaerobaculia bacterium]